jgi:hypothetical protein
VPDCLAQAEYQICHDTAIIGSMPVGSSCRYPDQISHLDAAWLGAFVTDPTGTSHNFQELSVLVGVPVGPCAGGECHVGDDDFVVHVDQVEVDINVAVGLTL